MSSTKSRKEIITDKLYYVYTKSESGKNKRHDK